MANKHSLFYTETQVHKKAKTRQGKARQFATKNLKNKD